MNRVSWIRIAVVAIAIGLLEVCCRLGLIDTRVVIPPSQMAEALAQLLISGRVNPEIARTFGIVLIAAVISVVAVMIAEMFAMMLIHLGIGVQRGRLGLRRAGDNPVGPARGRRDL